MWPKFDGQKSGVNQKKIGNFVFLSKKYLHTLLKLMLLVSLLTINWIRIISATKNSIKMKRKKPNLKIYTELFFYRNFSKSNPS